MTDSFQFEVPPYTTKVVERLMINYADIRSTLIDRMPKTSKTIYSSAKYVHREKPLGASASTPWPIMSRSVASPHTDGKLKANMMEDLHISSIDLENALKKLTKEEYDLVADYYIFGNGTIEELAQARGLSSKGRLQERIQRVVRKLVRIMNDE